MGSAGLCLMVAEMFSNRGLAVLNGLCFDGLCFDGLCFDGLCFDGLCFDGLCLMVA